ncbi:6-hydroxymethylpterin diphosphokinase MptE-like protein [Bacillus sp. USDA818B3_A]|uniref:6-hydroxymethylpterin diphosphokinase MptE-like protein n=1 Tax=Bacillus sp. USDA818B3_A TaxID=2698834 RepID=UPI00136BF97A|nr:6-hydroxymethylpterin diphosphokinase MptE-like protein [Bacillus sp. USDA818B3_A]
MWIREVFKRNKFTYYFIKKVRKFQFVQLPYYISRSKFNIKKILRVMNIKYKTPYEKLKMLKNIHTGERCFIVATGPSLTIEDLEKLKNEITISMNSICLAFNETSWRPTYYGIQDERVYSKLREQIEQLEVECKFISDTILNKERINLSKCDYIFPLDMLHHNYNPSKLTTKFSKDPYKAIYSGFTVTYSLIQMAVYMGFKEIYLLGADCNYSSDMKHHFKEHGIVDSSFLLAGERMVSSYKVAKEYADRHHIKIYNATRGGMLEVFERVDLDKVLSVNIKNSSSLTAG